MSRMIYEYTKSTLEKVSVDPIRFERELNKASKVLLEYELESLSKRLKFFVSILYYTIGLLIRLP